MREALHVAAVTIGVGTSFTYRHGTIYFNPEWMASMDFGNKFDPSTPHPAYKWWAWYPVRMENNQWRWLEHVAVYRYSYRDKDVRQRVAHKFIAWEQHVEEQMRATRHNRDTGAADATQNPRMGQVGTSALFGAAYGMDPAHRKEMADALQEIRNKALHNCVKSLRSDHSLDVLRYWGDIQPGAQPVVNKDIV